MSLEEATIENTKAITALNANLASILGGKAAPAAAARPPGRPKTPSLEEVKVMAYKVKEEKGSPAAVALIKQHGADTLGDMDKSQYAKFIAACEVVLNTEEAEETGDPAEL